MPLGFTRPSTNVACSRLLPPFKSPMLRMYVCDQPRAIARIAPQSSVAHAEDTASRTQANRTLQLKKYMDLDQRGNIIAEYVWIDGSGGIRSKSKVSASPATSTPLLRPSTKLVASTVPGASRRQSARLRGDKMARHGPRVAACCASPPCFFARLSPAAEWHVALGATAKFPFAVHSKAVKMLG